MIFMEFLETFWVILLELAPYLLLGLLIAGLLNAFVSRNFITRHLGKNNFTSVFKAALLGVPLPLCSCGVIPTGIAFKKQGASNGSTVSFLVSTPQTGVDSILVSYSMLSLPWAIFRPIVAFVTGIAAGMLTPTENNVESNQVNEEELSTGGSLFDKIFKYAFIDFLQDISRALIVGIILAALISLFVPEELFSQYLSYPLMNMLIILVVSVPLYVCATGSVPIAAALLMKGLSPGAALVFLMAGPATNAATLTVLWNSLGKKITLVYLGTIVVFSFGFGVLIDYLLPSHWFLVESISAIGHQHHLIPDWLSMASAVILIAALSFAEIKKLIPHKIELNTMEKAYKIEGMTCNHCKANVERALNTVEGISSLEVDLEAGVAKIEGNASHEKVKAAVEGVGYGFKGEMS
ncbi:MAG: heavy metal-associated domain-containing protein [Crocinitomicaceae bacterium]|nr:heavy metal-associated domain-containing protein [Crocinitomicaceae bacterium]